MDQFMEAALEEARRGAAEGGIPIGAALVDGQGRLVATGRNHRIQDRAVVMHAEINCLLGAGKDVEHFQGIPSTQHSCPATCALGQLSSSASPGSSSENFQEGNGLGLMLQHRAPSSIEWNSVRIPPRGRDVGWNPTMEFTPSGVLRCLDSSPPELEPGQNKDLDGLARQKAEQCSHGVGVSSGAIPPLHRQCNHPYRRT